MKGRVFYGVRCVDVDAAKKEGILREALKEDGGWTDTQVPDSVYADQDAIYARDEAKEIRARIRCENHQTAQPEASGEEGSK